MSISRSVLSVAVVGAFFALTLAVQHHVFSAPTLYDSDAFIRKNEYVFNGGLVQVIKAFPQRPLPMITFYLNWLAAG